jgi:PAS domain S-box-containing protein
MEVVVFAPNIPVPADPAALTKTVSNFLQTVLERETAVRAYQKWLGHGCPRDSQIRDWLEAKAELAPLQALVQRLAENNTFLREYVTARGRLEEALKITEERYRQLFQESLTGNAVSTPDGNFVLCNPAFARLFGFGSVAEALRANLTALYPRRDDHIALLARVRRERVVEHAENEMIGADGRRLAVLGKTVGTFAADGELLQVQQFLLDVTDRRRAEEELQRNYTLLHDILEGTADAVFVKDVSGRYVLMNSTGARFVGKTVAEVVGGNDTSLFPPEVARLVRDQDVQVMSSGRTHTFEVVSTIAGALRTFQSMKTPYRDPQGNIIGVIGVSRDISERKRARQRLQAEHDVARALAEFDSLPEAALRILQSVCENLGWDMGFFWAVDAAGETLRCVQTWVAPGVSAPALLSASRELAYSKGMGLPGQVWAQGERVWSADVAGDPNILYRGPLAAREGLRAAAAFPVGGGGDFLGVIEFFGREMGEPDAELLDAMNNITLQVRQFMGRKKAERALHEREREFAIAREIQQGLLPRAVPRLPGFRIAGVSCPAQETGGDYFDYFPLGDGTLALAVGDASGHGIGAALLMAETRAYLRALALTRDDLGHILELVNRRLTEDTTEDHYVTLLLARLDPVRQTLSYGSAGHWPGLVLDAAGEIKATLDSTGMVLGFEPAGVFELASEVALAPGDLVLLCTDGFAEAFSKTDESFGKERVLDLVRARRQESPEQIVEVLCREVREFCGGQQVDDMTAVVVKVE